MKRVPLIMTILLLTFLLLSGSVFAQDMDHFVFCGDLSAEDCDILMASQEATMSIQSAATDFEISMSVMDVPDMPFDELTILLNGNGAFEIDPAVMEMLGQAQMDPSQFFDPENSMALLGEMIGGFAGDMTLTLAIPPQLASFMGGEDQPMPETLTIGLRLVDGVAYINLDDVAAAVPDGNMPAGWMGVDLVAAFDQFGGMMDMGAGMGTFDPSMFQDYMQGVMDPELMSEFMTVERVADRDVMGQTAAVFRFDFDYGAFMQSELFADLMSAQMDAVAAASGDEMSEDDRAEVEAVMDQMFDAMANVKLEILQVIGLDDFYMHSVEVHMDWDLGGFIAVMEPDVEASDARFTFDVVVNSSDFNSDFDITAPEDAVMLPLENMMSGMQSMQ